MRTDVDTGTGELLAWVEDGIGVVSLNRPDARNALSDEIYFGLERALPQFAKDRAVRCVVVTGEGGAFCAGGDVKGFAAANADPASQPTVAERVDYLRYKHRVGVLALHKHPKVTIAAIPGPAAGAGVMLALSCDFRIAAERASLVPAYASIAVAGDFGSAWFLNQLLGPMKAREFLMLGQRLSAQQALEAGLLTRVVPDADFDAGWRAFAAQVAAGPTLAFRSMKENLARAAHADLASYLEIEAANMIFTMTSEDHKAAVRAFVEKRPPAFEGR